MTEVGAGNPDIIQRLKKGWDMFVHGRDRSVVIRNTPLTPDQILEASKKNAQEVYHPQPTPTPTLPQSEVGRLASERQLPTQIKGGQPVEVK